MHVQDKATGIEMVVSGSKRISRDLSTRINWWELRPQRDIQPREVDENGKPFELCSGGHYRPRRAFDVDTGRKTGLRAYCKQCRHEQYIRQSSEAAERAGKALRRYRDRKQA